MSDKKHIRTFRSKKLHPEHVKTLNEAIRKNAKGGDYNVHIQYTKPDGTKSERKIKPLGVKDKSLLLAHCHERNAIRSFRVERVSMVKQAFWDGFEKEAAIDWFYRNRNKTTDRIHQDLGSNYEKNHIDSYVRNLRPWESGKPEGTWKTDVKRLYDKKEDYNKLQKGLLETAPGSPEEKKYMSTHGKNMDAKLIDWADDNATTAKAYNSAHAKRIGLARDVTKENFKPKN